MRRGRTLLTALAVALLSSGAAAKPMRVMSLNQCTDQLVLGLLPPERITSVTWLSRDAETSLMAAAARRVAVNHGAAEEVVRDRPDLVIAGSFSTPATRALVKRLGYRLLEVDEPTSFAAIARVTRQVAAAVGEPARGEAWLARMDASLATLARDAGPPIRVAAWDGAGFAARPGSLYDIVIRAAGARNVAADAGARGDATPSVETLLAVRPALLVRGDAGPGPAGRQRDIAHHPLVERLWRDRTVVVPPTYTLCGTPASADAALLLRRQLSAAVARAGAPSRSAALRGPAR